MILAAGATLVDVAFAACTVLAARGRDRGTVRRQRGGVLRAGPVSSLDVDFVVEVGAAPHVVDRALATLGYTRVAEGHYRHDTLPYTLAFPIGPLAIGREYVTAWRTDRRDDLLLHVYTPTDVVRDRFLHYWAWGDRTALDVALAVAARPRRRGRPGRVRRPGPRASSRPILRTTPLESGGSCGALERG